MEDFKLQVHAILECLVYIFEFSKCGSIEGRCWTLLSAFESMETKASARVSFRTL